LAERT